MVQRDVGKRTALRLFSAHRTNRFRMKMSWHKKVSRLIRGRIRRKVLARHGIGVCVETYNGRFVVDPGDFVVSRSLLERGEYDRPEIEWLSDIVGTRAGTLVIVGVHVGAVLVPLAKRAARVIGFEANPPTYRLAQLNLLLNETRNAELVNKAIGLGGGVVSIVANPINTGNASISASTGAGAETISLISLDSFCAANAVDSIDLLIVDIEGHEFHALRGAEQTLQRTANLYVEYAPEQLREHGTNPAELVDYVTDRFKLMYLFGPDVRAFTAAEAKHYLKNLPERKGLLLNLLLTNRELPPAALQRRGV